MNGRIKGTMAAITKYIRDADVINGSDVDGIMILQNIMETIRQELIIQRDQGMALPIREPTRPTLRWCDALIGMQGDGDK